VVVVGSVSAAQVAYWQLPPRPAGEGAWRERNRGFGAITNGVLGRLDPTQLPYDLYELPVRAVDINGRNPTSLLFGHSVC